MGKNYDVTNFFQNNFNLRRSRVTNFTDMIKIATMFINTIYIFIS